MLGQVKRLLLVLVLSLPLRAFAEAPEVLLQRANEAFRRTEFEQAIPLFRELLNPPLLTPSKIAQARMRLAESLFFTQHQSEAKRELHVLLANEPSAKTDASVPPDFADFFAATKHDYFASAPAKKKPKLDTKVEPTIVVTSPAPLVADTPAPLVAKPEPRPESRPTTAPPTTAPPVVAPPVAADLWHGAPWYLKIIPFGGGQFANHDAAGGGVFLALEVAFLATNIATTIINDKERSTYGGFRHTQPYPALYGVQLGSAVATYATLVVGLIDAFVWSPTRGARHVHATVAPTADGHGAAAFLGATF